MIWGKLKLYAFAALAALIAVLGGFAKYYKGKAGKEKKRADNASGNLDRQMDIQRDDKKIEQTFKSRRADAAKEIRDGRAAGVFLDPNKLFDNDKNG
jgi:hypothetical protein